MQAACTGAESSKAAYGMSSCITFGVCGTQETQTPTTAPPPPPPLPLNIPCNQFLTPPLCAAATARHLRQENEALRQHLYAICRQTGQPFPTLLMAQPLQTPFFGLPSPGIRAPGVGQLPIQKVCFILMYLAKGQVFRVRSSKNCTQALLYKNCTY